MDPSYITTICLPRTTEILANPLTISLLHFDIFVSHYLICPLITLSHYFKVCMDLTIFHYITTIVLVSRHAFHHDCFLILIEVIDTATHYVPDTQCCSNQ